MPNKGELTQRHSADHKSSEYELAFIGPQHTDEIVKTHVFSQTEQWLVFLATFVTACSFYAVVVVLWK